MRRKVAAQLGVDLPDRLYLDIPPSYRGTGHIRWLRARGMRWDQERRQWFVLSRSLDYRVLQFVAPGQLSRPAPAAITRPGISRVNS